MPNIRSVSRSVLPARAAQATGVGGGPICTVAGDPARPCKAGAILPRLAPGMTPAGVHVTQPLPIRNFYMPTASSAYGARVAIRLLAGATAEVAKNPRIVGGLRFTRRLLVGFVCHRVPRPARGRSCGGWGLARASWRKTNSLIRHQLRPSLREGLPQNLSAPAMRWALGTESGPLRWEKAAHRRCARLSGAAVSKAFLP